MWAIPTGTSSASFKKKNQVKSPSIWSRVPETGSDTSNGSDRDLGHDNETKRLVMITNLISFFFLPIFNML